MTKTVLIIDDDHLIREMLNDAFKTEGFRVFSAEDGEKGFELMTKVNPEVVILDKLMPKASGGRFLMRAKDIKLQKKPVLVVYSSLVKEYFQESDPGSFACVVHSPKSTTPEDLVKMVGPLMDQYLEPKK